mgnify:CR=1 FL=1
MNTTYSDKTWDDMELDAQDSRTTPLYPQAGEALVKASDCQDRIRALEAQRDRLREENRRLRLGLEESLKHQSHYAKLLNMYDGGERMEFDSVESWLKRLKETAAGHC